MTASRGLVSLDTARRIEIAERASYIIQLGDIPGVAVTDALTGRIMVGGVVIGEPLCAGCDEPIADGLCACQRIPDLPRVTTKVAKLNPDLWPEVVNG